ncbi:MAG: thiamine phosphate synthase, partial [Candidatus Binatia bacterium]
MNAVDFDLYLVTDRTQTGGRDLLWVIEQALDAGVKAVQLREKDLSG